MTNEDFHKLINKPTWNNINEKQPDESGFYLIFTKQGGYKVAYFTTILKQWSYRKSCFITHWIDLPENPKNEDKKNFA